MNQTLRKKICYRYIILAFSWAILGWLFIYTHDDFAWGSMHYIFPSDVNGRYAGHLFSLTLTRSRVLKMVIITVTMTGIVYCIERIFKTTYAYLTAVLSILCLPRIIFRQAIAWVSGFANYATAVLFLLIFFVYIVEHMKGYAKKDVSLLVVLGVVNSLFVEHSTIFNLVLAISIVGYYIIHKHIRWDYICYCAGSVGGTIAMLSHPVYHVVLNHEDGYRAVAAGGILVRMKENYLGVIFQEAFFNNLFLNTLLLGVCIMLFLQYPKEKLQRGLLRSVVILCLLIMCIFWSYSTYMLLKYGYAYASSFTGYQRTIAGALTFLTLICSMICTFVLSSTMKNNYSLLCLWVSFIMLIAPLFVVTPIGSRCFFGSYIILVIILCNLLSKVSWDSVMIRCRYLEIATVFVILSLFVRYYYIYGRNYTEDQKRIDYVIEAVNNHEEVITIPRLPYENYLWVGSPDNEYSEAMFKRYYKIPANIKVIVQ